MLAGKNGVRTFTTTSRRLKKSLTMNNINSNIKTLGHITRGPLHEQATAIERELQEGKKKPFEKVLLTSTGDSQQMGQPPITYVRQVLACLSYTPLLDDPKFPADVKERARLLLSGCRGGSVGSYSDPGGIHIVRKHCAEYIANRDGVASDWNRVTLHAGASEGIRSILKMMSGIRNGKNSAILVPAPGSLVYPTLARQLGMGKVDYYLDEHNEWDINIEDLKRAVSEGRKKYNVRAIVIINPGNPSGQVFSKETLEAIIKFVYEENLYVIADEVYQDNVYDSQSQFHSVKKIMMQLGAPYNNMQVASLHSISKGFTGECGMRSGYMETTNMHPDVFANFLKSLAAELCPSVLGQMALDCLVAPPKEGEPSYPTWRKEHDSILNSLKERATILVNTLNNIEGISCGPIQGAVSAFPKLPEKAIRKAKARGQAPDVFYASELLGQTGIVIVPGSEFGMPKDSCWLRTTILHQLPQLKSVLQEFEKFHIKFLEEYSN